MNFCRLVLELHLPHNFCPTHSFQKYSNRVRDIPKVSMHQKLEDDNFYETNTFFCFYRRHQKSSQEIIMHNRIEFLSLARRGFDRQPYGKVSEDFSNLIQLLRFNGFIMARGQGLINLPSGRKHKPNLGAPPLTYLPKLDDVGGKRKKRRFYKDYRKNLYFLL